MAHVAGWGMHTLPQLFMLMEWRYSSIPFSWYRFLAYLFIVTAYGLVNVSMEERFNDDLYSSIDWKNKPEQSTMFALGTNACVGIGFAIMKYITD